MDRWNPRDKLPAAILATMLFVAPFIFYSGPESFILPREAFIGFCVWCVALSLFALRIRSGSALTVPFTVFILLYLSAAILSDSPLSCWKPLAHIATGLSLALCVSAVFRSASRLRLLRGAIVLVGSISSLHGIAQFFGFDFGIFQGVRFRVFATAGTPAALSLWLAVSAAFVWGAVLVSRDWRRFAFLFVVWTLNASCLLLTFSRSGLLAGLIAHVVVFYFVVASRGTARNAVVRGAAVIVLSAALFGALLAISKTSGPPLNYLSVGVLQREIFASGFKRDSLRQRRFILRTASEMFWRRPFLGSGPGAFKRQYPRYQAESLRDRDTREAYGAVLSGRIASHAHNDYAEFAVEGGALSLAAFIFLIATALFHARRGVRDGSIENEARQYLLIGAFGGVVAVLSQAMFEFPLRDPMSSMLFWSLIGAVSTRRDDSGDSQPERQKGAIVIAAAACVLMMFISVLPFLAALLDMKARKEFATDPARSIRLMETALRIDPAEPRLNIGFAGLAAASGDYERAVGLLRAAKQYSSNPEIYSRLGQIYAVTGRPEQAIHEIKTAIEIDPWRAAQWYNLAQVQARSGHGIDARRSLRRAVRLRPDFEPARKALLQMDGK